MDAMNCIRTRRSVRRFTGEAVPRRVIEKIVETVRFSPSWRNTESIRYHIVTDPAQRTALAEKAVPNRPGNQAILRGCAAVAVLTIKKGVCGYNDAGELMSPGSDRWEMFDAGIAAQSFCLAAHSLGIGTVILGSYEEAAVCELTRVPEDEKLACLIAMGIPAERNLPAPPRRDVGELLSFQ